MKWKRNWRVEKIRRIDTSGISHLYTNLLSCFVSLDRKGTTYNRLSSVGRKISETRYASVRERTRGNLNINYAEEDGKSFNE